jgi:hypothetical protein
VVCDSSQYSGADRRAAVPQTSSNRYRKLYFFGNITIGREVVVPHLGLDGEQGMQRARTAGRCRQVAEGW